MNSIDQKFFNKLQELDLRYNECLAMLNSVEVASDPKLFRAFEKEQAKLKPVAELFKEYSEEKKQQEFLQELYSLAEDLSERAKIKSELEECEILLETLQKKLKQEYLLMNTSQTERAKIEITLKSGSKDFVNDLRQIFERFAQTEGLEICCLKNEETSLVLQLDGNSAYEKLGSLSGIYCQILCGKKSEAIVVILNLKIFDTNIDDDEFVIQTSKSGGAGGQHINKTESAVKIIHTKTGLFAECEDERSQQKNKERAMQNLKEKVLNFYKQSGEKDTNNQRSRLKSAIFSNTPILIFDCDKNIVSLNKLKKSYNFNEIKKFGLQIITNDLRI